MSEITGLFKDVTSCEEFQEVVVENKKALWGERIGDCTFGGAGGKAILLNTPEGKEFVSYANAYNGKGKYGRLLKDFFFGASEEDKMSVTDILNLIDENLSDEDIALLKESLFKDESSLKIRIGDVFGAVGLTTAVDVQDIYDEIVSEYKAVSEDKSSKDRLIASEILKHKSLILGNAICRYWNSYDFVFDALSGEVENVHLVKFARTDRPFIRRMASENYIMFSTSEVDALEKISNDTLELRLLYD